MCVCCTQKLCAIAVAGFKTDQLHTTVSLSPCNNTFATLMACEDAITCICIYSTCGSCLFASLLTPETALKNRIQNMYLSP